MAGEFSRTGSLGVRKKQLRLHMVAKHVEPSRRHGGRSCLENGIFRAAERVLKQSADIGAWLGFRYAFQQLQSGERRVLWRKARPLRLVSEAPVSSRPSMTLSQLSLSTYPRHSSTCTLSQYHYRRFLF